ncbi:MAG: response regulator [Nitrospirae bacterium]|nr:MAG: response regulator [Nitrospirota bacterium]
MKKILVVEDNEDNLYLVSYFLRKSGYEVVEARSGEDGIAAALTTMPDAILMDIHLPGIDGLDAAKKIKESESGCMIPIIALTSQVMPGDRERAFKSGCSGYIEKPINIEVFMSEITRHLKINGVD